MKARFTRFFIIVLMSINISFIYPISVYSLSLATAQSEGNLHASSDKWEKQYKSFIDNNTYLSPQSDEFFSLDGEEGNENNPIAFALYDLDNDNIPELFINNGAESYATDCTYCYGFKDNRVLFLGTLGGSYYDKKYNTSSDYTGIFVLGAHSGYWNVNYYCINADNRLIEELVAYGDDSTGKLFDPESEISRTNNKDMYEAYRNGNKILEFISRSDYDSMGWDDFRNIFWGNEWDNLLRISNNYDHNLSLVAAEFSEESEDTNTERINKVYSKYGIENTTHVDYGGSYAYSIGHTAINGGNVIVITARGSVTDRELIDDGTTKCKEVSIFSNYSKYVYENAYNFEEKIWKGLDSYLDSNPEIEGTGKIKIAIFGHSLGGAAANLLAAKMDILLNKGEYLAGKMTSNDVYAYTFGAIDCITEKNVYKGFENIHNIYNYYDTFGPNGNGSTAFGFKPAGATSYGRFGNNERFACDFAKIDGKDDASTTWNHVQYKRAIEERLEYSNSILDYINFAALCPVDIEVAKDGNVIGKIVNNTIDKDKTSIPMYVYDEHKYFAVPKGSGYKIKINATDSGKMDCFMEEFLDEESYIKEYNNISLEKGKSFISYSGDNAADCKILLIDENEEVIGEVGTDGSEHLLERQEAVKITVSDNLPMDYAVETRGEYQIGYYHSVPFWGKTKPGATNFGKITVSGNNKTYEVSKVKVNKKKKVIQITGIQGADKKTVKDLKKATKGAAGLPFNMNPYYVKDTDKVTIKRKKNGSIKSVKVMINGKDYKAKKNEYTDGTPIIFKGSNLNGSY